MKARTLKYGGRNGHHSVSEKLRGDRKGTKHCTIRGPKKKDCFGLKREILAPCSNHNLKSRRGRLGA